MGKATWLPDLKQYSPAQPNSHHILIDLGGKNRKTIIKRRYRLNTKQKYKDVLANYVFGEFLIGTTVVLKRRMTKMQSVSSVLDYEFLGRDMFHSSFHH